MWDSWSKSPFTFLLLAKGPDYLCSDLFIVHVAAALTELSYKRIIVRTDGEAALVAFIRAVTKYWGGEVVPEKDEEYKEICTRCVEGFFDCDVKYDVLIHNSKETLINDLDTGPIVNVGMGKGIFAEISKSNLDSIATDNNPCIYEDDKLTRTEYVIDKVCITQSCKC